MAIQTQVTVSRLGEMLTEKIKEAIEIGKQGTDTEYTAAGMAMHLILELNLTSTSTY